MSALQRLRKRLHWLVLFGVIGVVGAVIFVNSTSDSYSAASRLFVGTSAKDVTQANQGTQAGQARVATYAVIATGPELLNRAAKRSGVDLTGAEIAGKLAVAPLPGTVLLDVAVTDRDPATAAKLADAVATELIAVVQLVEQPIGGGPPAMGLVVLAPAASDVSKVSKYDPTTLGSGLLLGLAVGTVLAVALPVRRSKGDRDPSSPDLLDDPAPRAQHSRRRQTALFDAGVPR